MKKHIFILLAVFCTAFCIFPHTVNALAADTLPADSGVSYAFDEADGTLTLYGTGAVPDYSVENPSPWNAYRTKVKQIVISEGITEIGESAFRQLTQASSVSLPKSLRSIHAYAFFHASSLTEVRFPAGVGEIGSFAFAACSSLQNVAFDDMASALNLGACAFVDCPRMLSAQFPAYTTFGQYSVGFSDEDGSPMSAFTLRGLDYSTAQYYAQNAEQIVFDNAVALEYKTAFGHTFALNKAADWYCYTPQASGTYHFYSYGDTDVSVTLYDSTRTTALEYSFDRDAWDTNFDLTCQLDAGKTYYFKVTPNHLSAQESGAYTAYLYPGKITSLTAFFPSDFILYTDQDGIQKTDALGNTYIYFDMQQYADSLQITVEYDNGYTDVFAYSSNEYNGDSFALTDQQETEHWSEGVYTMDLTYKGAHYPVKVRVHTHAYVPQTTQPTCTQPGQTVYTCSCGASYAVPIAALGHTEPVYYEQAPTCTENGFSYEYCNRCHIHLSEATLLPALGHNYSKKVVEPTQTAQGYTVFTCMRCGDSYVGDYKPAKQWKISGKVVVMEYPDGSHAHDYGIADMEVNIEQLGSCITDENGYFSFAAGEGEYTVQICYGSLMCRTLEVTVGEADLDLGSVAFMCFDINEDGYVNARDFVLFDQFAAGVANGEMEYAAYYDFNKDGRISAADMECAGHFLIPGKVDPSIYGD